MAYPYAAKSQKSGDDVERFHPAIDVHDHSSALPIGDLAGRRRAAHAFNEPLDVADRRLRQHAMAEIENKRALREGGKNCVA